MFSYDMLCLYKQINNILNSLLNSNDNDFIRVGLGGMGYSCRSYKKTIPNCKFIRGQFQIGIFRNKHFTSCNVSKCLMDHKISKEK